MTIRDTNGKWLDSQIFRAEGLKYMANKYYCPHIRGSIPFKEYWDEQLRRCKEGYEVDGHKITGHHYSYLNFSEIQLVIENEDGTVASKETKCPDFWDGDYDYYWAIEIARNGLFNISSLAPSTAEEKVVWNAYNKQMRAIEKDFLERELGDAYKRDEEFINIKESRDKLSLQVLDRLKLNVKPHLDYLGGGYHVIVGKSRRKGYSFKNANICTNTYNTIPNSLTVIGAFDKKYLYPKGTMGMASSYLSYLNDNTAWTKARDFVNKQEHKRASYEKNLNGIKVEAGYMSEIMAITFADNPEAARGKDAKYVLFEEAGVFPNLKDSYTATQPGLTAGKYITGQILIFGTGGDMESGTVDFADMFYHPMEYDLMPFVNIWDENAENSYCGFFHPVYMNMEGYYDNQGNSDIAGALAAEKAKRRQLLQVSTSSNVLQKRVQEYPICPAEAFLTVSINDFPVEELRQRYNKVIRENLHLKYGTPCYLTREGDRIRSRPDLNNILQPLWSYKPKDIKDLKGSVVMYEPPISNPPRGLYKIGYDPYRHKNSSSTHPSLAAIYVYKGTHKFSYSRDTIVASYVGRPNTPDDVNRIAEMLAELYNAEIMFENEVTHVLSYFTRKKKLHLLAKQPSAVIGRAVKKSGTDRTYGVHMPEKIKDAGEKYIKEWLLTVRDFTESGEKILNLDTLTDPALIEELIFYNRKGNFDRVMAFMVLMLQISEDDDGEEYGDEPESTVGQEIMEMMKTQFSKN